MPITRYEQETIINFNEEEESVSIYTASPKWKRYFIKLGFKLEKTTREIGNTKEISWSFIIPKNIFHVGKKRKIKLSDIKRAELRQRMIENIHSKDFSKGLSI